MTMSNDRRELYPRMTEHERKVIDYASESAINFIKSYGFKVAGDDRAENLVGAIARFVEDSKS